MALHARTSAQYLIATLIAICLLWQADLAHAKIYKWVDENGVTHFSSEPPPEQQTAEEIKVGPKKTIEAGQKTPELARFSGRWQGKRDGQMTWLMLDSRGYFEESWVKRLTGNAWTIRMYAGTWEVKNQRINFEVRLRGEEYERAPAPETAIIIERRDGKLVIDWDGDGDRRTVYSYVSGYGGTYKPVGL